MKGRVFISSLVVACFMLSSVEAQVIQLGRMPMKGKVKPTGGLLAGLFNKGGCCDAGCTGCSDPACGVPEASCGLGDPSCGAIDPGCGLAAPGCGLPEPGCGVAAPTCGLAGTLLGGGGSCSLPEPSCGSTGLGYSGGFGLCGGSGCDSCGSGGFLGRQLHQVNPCACGGSLIADMARGFLSLVDRTVGAVVGGIFGGLQAVTCHASGTFAALQCAAQASCDSCGGPGCDGGCAGPGYGVPSCGAPACGAPAAPSCGCPTCGVASSAPAQSYPVSNSYPIADSYAAPASNDIYLPPAAPVAPAMNGTAVETSPIPATPMESVPTQSIPTDPFIDDPISAPAPIPQASRTRSVPVGFRVFGKQAPQQVRTATYQQQQRLQQARSGVQQTGHNARAMAANVKPSKPHRYQQAKHRGVNLRR